MSSFYDNSIKAKIVFVIYPGVTLIDVAGPAQVFSSANSEITDEQSTYDIVIASLTGGLIATDTGITLNTIPLSELLRQSIDTLIVAGGDGVFEALRDQQIVDWLRIQMPLARRTASTCMGAFLMAETGLLAGQSMTTHWRWCARLQELYPELDVKLDPIYIKNGSHASAAGATAGIDLALSLVEDDHGREVALALAKRLVLYLKRPGGQSQFSSLLQAQTSERSDRFNLLNVWIANNLEKDLRVEVLASRANMGPRNFSRAYSSCVGQAPAKAVEQMRLEAAKALLETTKTGIKAISEHCGFKNYERMRRTFIRQMGVTPLEYRHRFGK